MHPGLDLYDSRIDHIRTDSGTARVFFSLAYIHRSRIHRGRDSGSFLCQEAELVVHDASISGAICRFPNTVEEGVLEIGGVRYDGVIPLPFKRRGAVTIQLRFVDGSVLEVAGTRPAIELLGRPIHLEGYG